MEDAISFRMQQNANEPPTENGFPGQRKKKGPSDKIYANGSLDPKTKHLMALAIALAQGNEAGATSHARSALEAGADRREILETISVALTLEGTAIYGVVANVLKLTDSKS